MFIYFSSCCYLSSRLASSVPWDITHSGKQLFPYVLGESYHFSERHEVRGTFFVLAFPLHISGGSHYSIPSTYHRRENWNFYNLQFVLISLGDRVIELPPDLEQQLGSICPPFYERIQWEQENTVEGLLLGHETVIWEVNQWQCFQYAIFNLFAKSREWGLDRAYFESTF